MATANRLYNRKYLLKIFKLSDTEATTIDNLNLGFMISKSGRNSLMGSDKAQIELTNPSTNTINLLREPDTFVELQLGYASGIKRAFIGKIEPDGIEVTDNGTDRILKIIASPAGNTFRETFMSLTIPPKTSLPDAMKKLKKAAESISSELATSIKSVEVQDILSSVTLEDGFSHTGSVQKAIEKLTSLYNVDYYVDGETMYMKTIDEALSSKDLQSVVLSPTTGLIGKPFIQSKSASSLSSTETNQDTIVFKALINTDLLCGLPIKVESDEINGWFNIENIVFRGQYRGNDWYAECTAVSM